MTLLLAPLLAFMIAAVTAPVGVSGAVFLLPVQMSVLHVPAAAVTPTNLLYNLVAIPGGLFRYNRRAKIQWPLTRLLVAGTIPGTVIGAVIRVYWLTGPGAFLLVVAGVLIPLGTWLVLSRSRKSVYAVEMRGRHKAPVFGLALLVGLIGGVYGIGGGSLLAPILVGIGYSVAEVAPAALASTLVTSVAGLITYLMMAFFSGSTIAPDWVMGFAMGVGGFAGAYVGAALQPWMPEKLLRRMLGCTGIVVGLYYIWRATGY